MNVSGIIMQTEIGQVGTFEGPVSMINLVKNVLYVYNI